MTTLIGINNRRNSVKAQCSKGTIWQSLERLLSEWVAVTSINYLVTIQINHIFFSPWLYFIGACQRITISKKISLQNILWQVFSLWWSEIDFLSIFSQPLLKVQSFLTSCYSPSLIPMNTVNKQYSHPEYFLLNRSATLIY